MKELVVISGKGGTGKTTVAAALAVLFHNPVIADCDVDAPDLHLVLLPEIRVRHEFFGGHEAIIRQRDCIGCGVCRDLCRFDAVSVDSSWPGDTKFSIDTMACEGCGVCPRFCPHQAIDFREHLCGEWMLSETRCGSMVHARMRVGGENSGKLVSTIRREARRVARAEEQDLVIVDGPPGIGCPVIASVTGASLVLVVTEPTVSGEHDLQRVLALTEHFGVRSMVCVNKWDINPEMATRIERTAVQAGARSAGRIRYDPTVNSAQMNRQAVVETNAPSAEDFRNVWKEIRAEYG